MKLGERSRIILFGSVYYIALTFLFINFESNYIITTFSYFLLPIIILLVYNKSVAKEVLLFCFSIGVPIGLYTQVIAERNSIWKYESLFDFSYVRGMPLDAVLWYPAWFAFILTIYVTIFKIKSLKNGKSFWRRHFHYLLFCFLLFTVSIGMLFVNEKILVFPHPYITLILPVILISIFLIIAHRHKHFTKVFLIVTLISLLPMLSYELVGLSANHWVYPGNYIFQVSFWNILVPIEELVIWMLIWPASVIAYFEEFETDFK